MRWDRRISLRKGETNKIFFKRDENNETGEIAEILAKGTFVEETFHRGGRTKKLKKNTSITKKISRNFSFVDFYKFS